jgi:DNA-3-methyladenine glycosylase II
MLMTNQLFTTTGTLIPRAPFDFIKTLAFIGDFTPTEGEQILAADSVTKAITQNGHAVAFELHSTGTTEAPQVAYTLFSQHSLSETDQMAVAERIRFFLSMDDDLQPFYAIGRSDSSFAPIIERFYGLHQPKFLTPFEIACWSILTQRQPIAIAHRVKMTLVRRWGTSITLPNGTTYWAFPEPAQLASVTPDKLAQVVRNERKVAYLLAVIKFFNEVDEQFLRSGGYEEVSAIIKGIKGIGDWSSHFILVRGLGRMEHVSTNDKELSKAAASIYNQGQALSPTDMQQIIDRYGSTQGYWAFYARIGTLSDAFMANI